jgi:hypothetical protein
MAHILLVYLIASFNSSILKLFFLITHIQIVISWEPHTGRLHQVEYAIEAINNAGTAVGILAADGIVLAGMKGIILTL